MLTRARWFLYGVVASAAATVLIVSRARRMRARLDADGVARVSAHVVADGLESAGRRLQRSALRMAPDESAVDAR